MLQKQVNIYLTLFERFKIKGDFLEKHAFFLLKQTFNWFLYLFMTYFAVAY